MYVLSDVFPCIHVCTHYIIIIVHDLLHYDLLHYAPAGNTASAAGADSIRNDISLYPCTCEAYSVVPVRPADHEYAYIAPPVALRRSTPPGIRRLQCSFVNRLMNTTAKLILSTKVQ